MSKVINGKSFIGQKSPWTKVSLDNCPLDICPLGQRSPWTTVPWTNVATPLGVVIISCRGEGGFKSPPPSD